jgi:hypothetical protein
LIWIGDNAIREEVDAALANIYLRELKLAEAALS